MPAARQHRRIRLAMVAQHPIHYHLPLYRAIARDPDIELRVLFMQEAWSSSGYDPEVGAVVAWGLPMFEGYAYEIFPNASPRRDGVGFWKFVNPRLIWRVLTGPHDVVYVHGHNHFTHVAAVLAARLGGKRVVVRTISYNLDDRPRHVRLIRWLLYRTFYTFAHVLLYIGSHNRRFFEENGARRASSCTRRTSSTTPASSPDTSSSGRTAPPSGRSSASRRTARWCCSAPSSGRSSSR